MLLAAVVGLASVGAWIGLNHGQERLPRASTVRAVSTSVATSTVEAEIATPRTVATVTGPGALTVHLPQREPDPTEPFSERYQRHLVEVNRRTREKAKLREGSYSTVFREMGLDEELGRKLYALAAVVDQRFLNADQDLRKGVYRTRDEARFACEVLAAEAEAEIKELLPAAGYERFLQVRREREPRSLASAYDIHLGQVRQELSDSGFERMVQVTMAVYEKFGVNPRREAHIGLPQREDVARAAERFKMADEALLRAMKGTLDESAWAVLWNFLKRHREDVVEFWGRGREGLP